MDWEPVKFTENGGDMVKFAGPSDEFCSGILDRLQFADFTIWQSGQNAIAIIKTGRYEGVDDGLGSLEGEMFSNASNTSNVEVGRFTNSVDVGLEGEGVVKDNTQVPGRRSRVDINRTNLDGNGRGGLLVFRVNGEELSLVVIELE